MKKCSFSVAQSLKFFAGYSLLAALTLLPLNGCKRGKHTSNPRLRQIDDLLDAQLHPGTPRANVIFYLHSQGFSEEAAADPHDLVAIVRHVDADTLRPEIARVTFHFDANDKLVSYDLVPASGALLQR